MSYNQRAMNSFFGQGEPDNTSFGELYQSAADVPLERRDTKRRRSTTQSCLSGNFRSRTPTFHGIPSELVDGPGTPTSSAPEYEPSDGVEFWQRRLPEDAIDNKQTFPRSLNSLDIDQRRQEWALTARLRAETQWKAGAGQPLNAAGTPAAIPLFAPYELKPGEKEECRHRQNHFPHTVARVTRAAVRIGRRAFSAGSRAGSSGSGRPQRVSPSISRCSTTDYDGSTDSQRGRWNPGLRKREIAR